MRRTTVLVERFVTLDRSLIGAATPRMRSTLYHHDYAHTGSSVFASSGVHRRGYRGNPCVYGLNMGRNLRPIAVLFGAAGVLTLIRQVIEHTDPAYYDPVTTLDYAAAWLTSIAGFIVAAAFAMWGRRSPIRRGSWLLLVASVAWALAAVGNLLGDVFDMSIGETLWTAGVIGFVLTLVAGMVALTVNSPYRWSGLFLIGYAAGIGFPDSGGLWLSGLSLVAMGFWIDRTAAKTDRLDTLSGSDTGA